MGLKVVITGASSGIGRSTALRFAKDGHDVFVTGRSVANLKETVRLAKGAGSGAVYTGIGDVGVEADVIRNYEEAIKALGHIDVLVLNAGTGWVQPLEEHSTADYDLIFNTNVRGVFLWLKAALPALKKQGSGQIVLVNSTSGLQALGPGISIYTASKYALTGMAEGLRWEVKGTGVKVASVFPGAVDTPIFTLPFWKKQGIDPRKDYALDLALLPEDIANGIATIVYQDLKSAVDFGCGQAVSERDVKSVLDSTGILCLEVDGHDPDDKVNSHDRLFTMHIAWVD